MTSSPKASLPELPASLLARLAVACLLLMANLSAQAELSEASLSRSIVSVNVYRGKDVQHRVTGFVVQSDRFNGYVVTNALSLPSGDIFTVSMPHSGTEMIAQVMRMERTVDFALLKVNGLNAPALPFSRDAPNAGNAVWSAVKLQGDNSAISLARGTLENNYTLAGNRFGLFTHTAVVGNGTVGSVLLNECGDVIGLNLSTPSNDGAVRATDTATLRALLVAQNIKLTIAPRECLSDVLIAKRQAEQASEDARRAQSEAEKAQIVARSLERKLAASSVQNQKLIEQTQESRRRADNALVAAEKARQEAARNRLTLQERTTNLRREALLLKEKYEQDQATTRDQFEVTIRTQEEAARQREYVLMGLVIVLFIGVLLLLIIRRGEDGQPLRQVVKRARTIVPGLVREKSEYQNTVAHSGELREYVLDGRDDSGIRYLLRISSDQLSREDGVVIGRNPGESLYIINHADVSRQHVRMKTMRNRVFVEDLGSTNGTSVNGQSIEDKGPVSVENGDQIIIGSVVMSIKVMLA